jgi:apolipoprotein N-acyltransferase
MKKVVAYILGFGLGLFGSSVFWLTLDPASRLGFQMCLASLFLIGAAAVFDSLERLSKEIH